MAYGWTRFIGGIPSRLFLLLVGVSMAIRFESQLAAKVDRATMVRTAAKRGLEVLALGLPVSAAGVRARRLLGLARPLPRRHPQLHRRVDGGGRVHHRALARAAGDPPDRAGGGGRHRAGADRRPDALPVVLAAAADLVPRRRAADGLVPAVSRRWPGRWWASSSATTGCARAATRASRRSPSSSPAWSDVSMMRAVGMVRAHNPYIIRYPSDLVQQMGPGTFFYRLGQIGPLALLAYLVTRHLPAPLVLADAALRADVAARLLGSRRARLRPPARPAAPPAQHVGRHGRPGPDDGGDGCGWPSCG